MESSEFYTGDMQQNKQFNIADIQEVEEDQEEQQNQPALIKLDLITFINDQLVRNYEFFGETWSQLIQQLESDYRNQGKKIKMINQATITEFKRNCFQKIVETDGVTLKFNNGKNLLMDPLCCEEVTFKGQQDK